MHTRRAIVAVVALSMVSLGLTACTPQELGDFFAEEDLRSSEEPVDQASGHAGEAINSDSRAQELADQALRERDASKLQDAYRQRPRDARYPAYAAAMALADDHNSEYLDILNRSSQLYVKQRSEGRTATAEELYREWLLVFLGALDHVLTIERERQPLEPARIERLGSKFCAHLTFYLERYDTESRDVLSVLFLGGAECEGAW